MKTTFKPNVDLMKVFNSQIMLINDVNNSENGQILIKAGADGPPLHTHPEQEEYFKIIKGQLQVYHANKWVIVHEGEEIFTPKNMVHSYRSRDTEDCLFAYHLTPRRNFSTMLQTFEKLTNEGKLKSTSDIQSIIYLAMAFKKYSSEIVSTKPPAFVMSMMAGIGKLLRFKI